MKALVYDGPNKIKVVDKEIPKVQQPGDAVVKLTRTTICGRSKPMLLRSGKANTHRFRSAYHPGSRADCRTWSHLGT